MQTTEYIFSKRENIPALTEVAFLLSMACLWPGSSLPSKETLHFRRLIRGYFLQAAQPFEAYLRFCQQVLNYQRRLNAAMDDEIRLPAREWIKMVDSEWLGRDCKRSTNNESMALGYALLDMIEEGACVAAYWEQWFEDRKLTEASLLFGDISQQLLAQKKLAR
ncbi:MAG: hypothetical protein JWQ27_2312 [Ferruginibacter sp.]|nr:hypothetical protein [Ferruginibacter sp.]